MLSIEECRKLIGEKAKEYSDEEIMLIRQRISELAEICLDHYFETKKAEAEEGLRQTN